ncbi:MAG: HEAT repeat domain-containing protein [Verrucomicrobiia bacterium]
MNRRISCLAIAIGVVFTFVCLPASARIARGGNPGDVMRLVSIDLLNNQITVSDPAGNNNATYALTPLTAVTINGQLAKSSDLRPGMRVCLSVIQNGRTADKIDATGTPPAVSARTMPKPEPAPAATPAPDIIASSPFWSLLNEDQRLIAESTAHHYRGLLYSGMYDDWTDVQRAAAEQSALNILNGPRPDAYSQAISTLTILHSASALPRLRELAFNRGRVDNQHRWLAVRGLGIIGDRSAVPDMIHLLYHRNLDTRWWAQISLVELTGQNFGKDWNAWGTWWNRQHGRPLFNPEIIRWWSGQAEPDKLAHSFDEADRLHFQNLSSKPPD